MLNVAVLLQEVAYALWACEQHDSHLDELTDQALAVVAGRTGELSAGELAKLTHGLVEADARVVCAHSPAACSFRGTLIASHYRCGYHCLDLRIVLTMLKPKSQAET